MGKGGGGSSGPQTVNQTSLPEYAEPYYERMMMRAEAESNQPYVPYQGQRLAFFSPDTQQAFGGVRDIYAAGTPASFDTARDTYSAGAGYSSGYGPQSYSGGTFGSSEATQYMNPYIENVLDRERARINELYNEQLGASRSEAVAAGAFGGSRQAIREQEMQEDLNEQLIDTESRLLHSGYQNAQQMFEADRQARLAAEGMTDESRRMAEQFRQSGIGLGYQGAGGLAGLGELEQQMGLERAQEMAQIGSQQQALKQTGLDLGYQDFINQRDYERQNLRFLSGLLSSTPVTPDSSIYTQPPDPYSQLLGLGIGAYGLFS